MVSKSTLRLAIFTLFTIIVWSVYEFYDASRKDVLEQEYYQLDKPLNPEINDSLLKSLNDRISY